MLTFYSQEESQNYHYELSSAEKKKSSFYHSENPSVTIKQNTDQDALVPQECRRDVCILEGGQLQLRFCCPVCFLP